MVTYDDKLPLVLRLSGGHHEVRLLNGMSAWPRLIVLTYTSGSFFLPAA